MNRRYESWGRYPRLPQIALRLHSRNSQLPIATDTQTTYLPYGNGRSYGDSCLNGGGHLLDARGLDRFIGFDPASGLLRCEAGVLLDEILRLVVPQGWFLPVTPGTRFVTIGGAIANDVHGKNHHRAGSFGCHIRCFELLRSDGRRLVCSPTENADWFAATIGGLGLTGVIVWAEIVLKRIANPTIDVETLRFSNLDGFFDLCAASDRDFEYTVAWIDCLARGRNLGRGLFMRANHAAPLRPNLPLPPKYRLSVPVAPPVSLINGLSLRLFNQLYYHRQYRRQNRRHIHYEPFFYPLDAIGQWNRMYGPRGFLQYQCVIPRENERDAIRELLQRIAAAGSGSFLAVLKAFGDRVSPGLLSFPRPGVTLALDFPNQGQATFQLLDELDTIVAAVDGAVYPAKDARMPAVRFKQYFPLWEKMMDYKDPCFSSNFWRRVTENPACAES